VPVNCGDVVVIVPECWHFESFFLIFFLFILSLVEWRFEKFGWQARLTGRSDDLEVFMKQYVFNKLLPASLKISFVLGMILSLDSLMCKNT